jgi:Tol biopolymer transport system component
MPVENVPYTVRVGMTIVQEGTISVPAGGTATITVTGFSGSLTLTVAGVIGGTSTVECIPPTATPTSTPTPTPTDVPQLSIQSVCTQLLQATFTLSNPSGTSIVDAPYIITDSVGNTVQSGVISVQAGGSATLTVTGIAGTLMLSVTGVVTATSTVECIPPTATPTPTPPPTEVAAQVTGTGICTAEGVVTFTLNNPGGTVVEQAYIVTNAAGTVLATGTVTIPAGGSATITVSGTPGTVTLTIPGLALSISTVCAEPPEELPCGYWEMDADGFPVFYYNTAACEPESLERVWEPITIGGASCPAWSVYHTFRTGDWELFRLGEIPGKPDAPENLSQAINPDWHDINPSRSPDNEWIAYASNRSGTWNIWVARTDGSEQRQATFNERSISVDPVWSPDGRFIAYESNKLGNWEIFVFDVTQRNSPEVRLTDNRALDVNPYWSPDSKKIIFESLRDGIRNIYELDIETLDVTRLSDGQGVDRFPQYSNKGDKIAFVTEREGRTTGQIAIMNADGSDVQLISDPNGDASAIAWSPNDELIAYQMRLGTDIGIYVYELATGITRRVTDTQSLNTSPTWICESTTLLFTSNAPGNADIYSTNALPITAPPIDVKLEGSQLTDHPQTDRDPQNTPSEEDASTRKSRDPKRQ